MSSINTSQNVNVEIEISTENLELAKKMAKDLREYFNDSNMYKNACLSEKIKTIYKQELETLENQIDKIPISDKPEIIQEDIERKFRSVNEIISSRIEIFQKRLDNISREFSNTYVKAFDIDDPEQPDLDCYTIKVNYENTVDIKIFEDGDIEGMLNWADVEYTVKHALKNMGYNTKDIVIDTVDYAIDDEEKIYENMAESEYNARMEANDRDYDDYDDYLF